MPLPFIKLARLIVTVSAIAAFPGYAQDVQTGDAAKTVEQKFYDVEIIVFKNLKVPKGQEINLPTPSPTRKEDTLDLADPAQMELASEKGFTALQPDELQLMETVSRIVHSSRYELLTHVGWRQPGLDKTQAISVWIRGGKIFGNTYSSIDQFETSLQSTEPETETALPPLDLEAEAEAENEAGTEAKPKPRSNVLYELEGEITIILARYLHTQADLVLRKPADMQSLMNQRNGELTGNDGLTALQGQILLNYRLKERRRMRSKRLHYLDHPEFGMLVLITPYQKPETEAEAKADSKTPDQLSQSPKQQPPALKKTAVAQ